MGPLTMKPPPQLRPSPVQPPDSAIASATGKYSGLQPAITALTATCSTVAVLLIGMNRITSPFFLENPANNPGLISASFCSVISSSGLWLVPVSISFTRSSVGNADRHQP